MAQPRQICAHRAQLAPQSLFTTFCDADAMDIDVDGIREHLEHESVVREKLKDETTNFEKKTRVLTGLLNKIHSTLPADGARRLNAKMY